MPSDNVPYLFWATNEQCGLNYIYGKIIGASLIKKQNKTKNLRLTLRTISDSKITLKRNLMRQKPFSSILEKKKILEAVSFY